MNINDLLLTNGAKVMGIKLEKKSEIILSDGRFATIFKTKAGHMIVAKSVGLENLDLVFVRLFLQVVKIDDKELTLDDVMNLDNDDYLAIVKEINM